jgi:anti-sigma28 factor (negative regulator of flagellin synthesis)
MDIADNDPCAMNRSLPQTEAVSFDLQSELDTSERTGADEKTYIALSAICELDRQLTLISEAREAKIRELQESIKHDTYHVTSEELADKMLRSLLGDDLTQRVPARPTIS